MFWFLKEKKTLKERMSDAVIEYCSLRYTYRRDLSTGGVNPRSHTWYWSPLEGDRDIENGMNVREALVKKYQGELLRLMLRAARERGPSRKEYGEKWEPLRRAPPSRLDFSESPMSTFGFSESPMSTKRLTDDELASFLIGQAIRKQLDDAPHDPKTLKEIEAVFGWLQKWIKPDDLHSVSLLTGYLINGDFDGEVPSIKGHSSLRRVQRREHD
jgi:hypothetical protein